MKKSSPDTKEKKRETVRRYEVFPDDFARDINYRLSIANLQESLVVNFSMSQLC